MTADRNSDVKFVIALFTILVVVTGGVKGDYRFGVPQNLGPVVNSSGSDGSPDISADGLSLYFDCQRPGGFGGWDIWVTTRMPGGEWGQPVVLPEPINGPYADAGPSISADGLSLYFASDRPSGLGNFDIWVTTRKSRDDPWDPPVNLGSKVNTSSYDNHPSISADGLSLYFDSARPGGMGYDIWMTKRKTLKSPWETPVNLGWAINDVSIELSPYIHSSGLILLYDSRLLDRDILIARRPTVDEPWGLAEYLGEPVNTWDYETDPSLSADGSMLYFGCYWPGGSGGQDLWQVPVYPVVDFNGDKVVNLNDFAILARYWQGDNASVDIGPTPFGDFAVDVRDAVVLADHWLEDLRCIAHWKLDATAGTVAHDSIGQYDATLQGDPTWRPTGGKIGGAVQFDGIDDYITTPYVLDPSADMFSVFAWVQSGGPGQVILSQSQTANWLLADSKGCLMTELRTPGRLSKTLVSPTVITDGAWHRVGLTWDGANRTLYVDNVEVAKDTQPALTGSTLGLHIGAAGNPGPGTFWSGLIDDIRLYKQAIKP